MGEMGRPLAIGFMIFVAVLLIVIGVFRGVLGSVLFGAGLLGLIYFVTRKGPREKE